MKEPKKINLTDLNKYQKEQGNPDYLQSKLKKEAELLQTISEQKDRILSLKEQLDSNDRIEDRIYRFYHQSFKVYDLQQKTNEIVDLFCKLIGGERKDLNPFFLEILSEGTEREFKVEHNSHWSVETRPIIEAYFHAKHILDLIVLYGINSDEAKRSGNAGWFTVLYLYNIR